MGWADYLSRHPVEEAPPVSKNDGKIFISLQKRIKKNMGEKTTSHQIAEKTRPANKIRRDMTKERMSHPTRKAQFRKRDTRIQFENSKQIHLFRFAEPLNYAN